MGSAEPDLALPKASRHTAWLGWSRTKTRPCCASLSQGSYLVPRDFREIHLFVTMEKFCGRTAEKESEGVRTLQVRADPSSVSPAMGIFAIQTPAGNNKQISAQKRDSSGEKRRASPSSLGSARLTQRCQSKWHRSALIGNQARRGEGERQRSQSPRVCRAQRSCSGGDSSVGRTRKEQAELKRIRPNGHGNFGQRLLRLCKHNRSR